MAFLSVLVGAEAVEGSARAEDAKKTSAAKDEAKKTGEPATDEPGTPGADAAAGREPKTDASSVEPPGEKWDISEVTEVPGKTYFFVGLRYRGNIIPKFMLNIFVDEGKTIYSNTIGAELDLRKDGFSLVPALSFTELGTGDILFKEKGTPDIAGNYSIVNSSMKVVYATADLLWSTKISKNVEFEYGAGFGLGIVFGGLITNWVREDPNGTLVSDSNKRFVACQTAGEGGPNSGCNAAEHQNSKVNKVGNYEEPSWFDGGSKPVVFPWIAVPQIGLRIKPIKQFVGRVGLGFALTGFWFGLSGEYGLEKKPAP